MLCLPMICLAIHLDGSLASVVPHRSETKAYTIEDALADLATLESTDYGAPPGSVSGRQSGERADTANHRTPEQCPVCGDRLARGQGLYTCPTCGWSDVIPFSSKPAGRGRDAEREESVTMGPEDANEDTEGQRPTPST